MYSKQKITLITSGQPSLNPRLVKEADALVDAGFEVTVIYQYWNNWGTEADSKLLPTKKWKAVRVGGNPTNQKLKYWKTRALHKTANYLCNNYAYNFGISELAIGRSSSLLIKKAKQIPADLYIAHNLAALPAAVKAAKHNKAKCGFDAEDFHRYEVTNDKTSKSYLLPKYLEDKYLSQINYLTAASPLIAVQYKKLYPNLNPVLINNVFPLQLQNNSSIKLNNIELNLVWFSQTIGKGRGLEVAIMALGLLKKENINLILIGNSDTNQQEYFHSLAIEHGLNKKQIKFVDPINPDDIINFIHRYDIGLALEENSPFNRDICLTNKIFTYLTSGIAVIASETAAQKQFIEIHPNIGKSFPIGNIEALTAAIKYYDENRAALYAAKSASALLAQQKFNWENESKIFLKLIEQTLASS